MGITPITSQQCRALPMLDHRKNVFQDSDMRSIPSEEQFKLTLPCTNLSS